eukprot:4199353-Lingulodinium_polyedra.AAC.1
MARSSSAVWTSRASPGGARSLTQAAQRSYPSGRGPESEALPRIRTLGARSLHSRHSDARALSQTATLP